MMNGEGLIFKAFTEWSSVVRDIETEPELSQITSLVRKLLEPEMPHYQRCQDWNGQVFLHDNLDMSLGYAAYFLEEWSPYDYARNAINCDEWDYDEESEVHRPMDFPSNQESTERMAELCGFSSSPKFPLVASILFGPATGLLLQPGRPSRARRIPLFEWYHGEYQW
jgi:hypothetical protein